MIALMPLDPTRADAAAFEWLRAHANVWDAWCRIAPRVYGGDENVAPTGRLVIPDKHIKSIARIHRATTANRRANGTVSESYSELRQDLVIRPQRRKRRRR